MKKIILIFITLAVSTASFAQISVEAEAESKKYSQKYDLLVSKLGPCGVGIETLLDNWEKVDPDNHKMLLAKFNYYLSKSRTEVIVPRQSRKYLGNAPILTLKDSTGADVNYFTDIVYDDSLFAMSIKNLDKAIRLSPLEMELKFAKAAVMIGYEKEEPDLTLNLLLSLVDEYYGNPERPWVFSEEPMERDFFVDMIQEYCIAFYDIASPASYKSFKSLSLKMSAKEPKNTKFITNLGTYYLIAEDDGKGARKYYEKVLKINPKDYTAIKNCVILSRKMKNVKLEMKYLAMLVDVTENEAEKLAAQARLDSLKGKK